MAGEIRFADAAPATAAPAIERLLADPASFHAPFAYASLEDVHRGTNGALIVHLQDAHANLSGQENLAGALDSVMDDYGISLVLAEGGWGDCSLTPIKKITTPDVWKKVARRFLVAGKLQGEEYLNLVSDRQMKIVGLEDETLYDASVAVYQSLVDRREKALDRIRHTRDSLARLKKSLYSEALLDYEKAAGRGSEADVEALTAAAEKTGFDLSGYPELQKLVDLKKREADIHFDLANLELAVLLEELAQKAPKEAARLTEFSRRDSANKLSLLNHFQNTLNIAKEKNVDFTRFQNLTAYVDYLKEFNRLHFDALLEEARKAEDSFYLKNLPSDDAKLVRSIDRFLKLLESAHRIQMTARQFSEFKANEPDMSEERYLAFLNRKLAERGYFDGWIPVDDVLAEGRKALDRFYELVARRDDVFLENLGKAVAADKAKSAFLITGGYHTQNLKQLLAENGYSYLVLTPAVEHETNQKKYEGLLLSRDGAEKKKVRVVSGESKAHDKPLGALDADLAKLIKKDRQTLRPAALMNSGARLAEIVNAANPDAELPSNIASIPASMRFSAGIARIEKRAAEQRAKDSEEAPRVPLTVTWTPEARAAAILPGATAADFVDMDIARSETFKPIPAGKIVRLEGFSNVGIRTIQPALERFSAHVAAQIAQGTDARPLAEYPAEKYEKNPYFAVTRDLTANAFVHGNRFDGFEPVYLYWKLRDDGFLEIGVADAARWRAQSRFDDLLFEARRLAYAWMPSSLRITGQQSALKSFPGMQTQYERRDLANGMSLAVASIAVRPAAARLAGAADDSGKLVDADLRNKIVKDFRDTVLASGAAMTLIGLGGLTMQAVLGMASAPQLTTAILLAIGVSLIVLSAMKDVSKFVALDIQHFIQGRSPFFDGFEGRLWMVADALSHFVYNGRDRQLLQNKFNELSQTFAFRNYLWPRLREIRKRTSKFYVNFPADQLLRSTLSDDKADIEFLTGFLPRYFDDFQKNQNSNPAAARLAVKKPANPIVYESRDALFSTASGGFIPLLKLWFQLLGSTGPGERISFSQPIYSIRISMQRLDGPAQSSVYTSPDQAEEVVQAVKDFFDSEKSRYEVGYKDVAGERLVSITEIGRPGFAGARLATKRDGLIFDWKNLSITDMSQENYRRYSMAAIPPFWVPATFANFWSKTEGTVRMFRVYFGWTKLEDLDRRLLEKSLNRIFLRRLVTNAMENPFIIAWNLSHLAFLRVVSGRQKYEEAWLEVVIGRDPIRFLNSISMDAKRTVRDTFFMMRVAKSYPKASVRIEALRALAAMPGSRDQRVIDFLRERTDPKNEMHPMARDAATDALAALTAPTVLDTLREMGLNTSGARLAVNVKIKNPLLAATLAGVLAVFGLAALVAIVPSIIKNWNPFAPAVVQPRETFDAFDREALTGDLGLIRTDGISDARFRRIADHYLSTMGFLRTSERLLYPGISEKELSQRIQHMAFAAVYLTYMENPNFETVQLRGGPAAGPFQVEAQSAADVFREAENKPEGSPERRLIEAYAAQPGVRGFIGTVRATRYNTLNAKESARIQARIAADETLQHLLWRLFIRLRGIKGAPMEPSAEDVQGRPGAKNGWPRLHEGYNTPYEMQTARPRNAGEDAALRRGLATHLKAVAVKALVAGLTSAPLKDALDPLSVEATTKRFRDLTVDFYQVDNVNAPLTKALRRIRNAEMLIARIENEMKTEPAKRNAAHYQRLVRDRRRIPSTVLALIRESDLERAENARKDLDRHPPKGYGAADFAAIRLEADRSIDEAAEAERRVTADLQELAKKLDPYLARRPKKSGARLAKQKAESEDAARLRAALSSESKNKPIAVISLTPDGDRSKLKDEIREAVAKQRPIEIRLDRFSSIPRAKDRLQEIGQALEFIAADMDRSLEKNLDLAGPLKELLNNAFYHGNHFDPSLPIFLRIFLTDRTIRVYDLASGRKISKAERSVLKFDRRLGGAHRALDEMENIWFLKRESEKSVRRRAAWTVSEIVLRPFEKGQWLPAGLEGRTAGARLAEKPGSSEKPVAEAADARVDLERRREVDFRVAQINRDAAEHERFRNETTVLTARLEKLAAEREQASPVPEQEAESVLDSIEHLYRALRPYHPLLYMRGVLKANDQIVIFVQQSLKTLNDILGQQNNNAVIAYRQQKLTELIEKEGLLRDEENGHLMSDYKQDEYAVLGDKDAVPQLQRVNDELSAAMDAYLNERFPAEMEKYRQANGRPFRFVSYFGLSGRLKFVDDASIKLADLQARQSAKMARLLPRTGESGRGYDFRTFEALMTRTQVLAKELNLPGFFDGNGHLTPEAVRRMLAVRGMSELEVRNALPSEYRLKRFLDLVDLFDYPKAWVDQELSDPHAMGIDRNLKALKTVVESRSLPEDREGLTWLKERVDIAANYLRQNLKEPRFSEASHFHVQASSRFAESTILSADAVGFYASTTAGLMEAFRRYTESARGETNFLNKQTVMLQEAIRADDEVKLSMKRKTTELIGVLEKSIEEYGAGVSIARLQEGWGGDLRLGLREGGDEVVLFLQGMRSDPRIFTALARAAQQLGFRISISHGRPKTQTEYGLLFTEFSGAHGLQFIESDALDKALKAKVKGAGAESGVLYYDRAHPDEYTFYYVDPATKEPMPAVHLTRADFQLLAGARLADKNVSTGTIGGISYLIEWQSPAGSFYTGDKVYVESVVRTLLIDKAFLQRTLNAASKHQGGVEDVVSLNVRFVQSSAKDVFRVAVGLRGASLEYNRKNLDAEGLLPVIALKRFRKEDEPLIKSEIRRLQELDGSGLTPHFGFRMRDFFFEQWIPGVTVYEMAHLRRKNAGAAQPYVTKEELRSIAAVWVKVGRILSQGRGNYSKFPTDMNAKNTVVQGYPNNPIFIPIVVDVGTDREGSAAYFMKEIMKHYVWALHRGVGVALKDPAEWEEVLEGVHDGFDHNAKLTADFLVSSITGPKVEQLLRPEIRAGILDFLVTRILPDRSISSSWSKYREFLLPRVNAATLNALEARHVPSHGARLAVYDRTRIHPALSNNVHNQAVKRLVGDAMDLLLNADFPDDSPYQDFPAHFDAATKRGDAIKEILITGGVTRSQVPVYLKTNFNANTGVLQIHFGSSTESSLSFEHLLKGIVYAVNEPFVAHEWMTLQSKARFEESKGVLDASALFVEPMLTEMALRYPDQKQEDLNRLLALLVEGALSNAEKSEILEDLDIFIRRSLPAGKKAWVTAVYRDYLKGEHTLNAPLQGFSLPEGDIQIAYTDTELGDAIMRFDNEFSLVSLRIESLPASGARLASDSPFPEWEGKTLTDILLEPSTTVTVDKTVGQRGFSPRTQSMTYRVERNGKTYILRLGHVGQSKRAGEIMVAWAEESREKRQGRMTEPMLFSEDSILQRRVETILMEKLAGARLASPTLMPIGPQEVALALQEKPSLKKLYAGATEPQLEGTTLLNPLSSDFSNISVFPNGDFFKISKETDPLRGSRQIWNEISKLHLLQERGVEGVPQVLGFGFMEDGRMWVELNGLRDAENWTKAGLGNRSAREKLAALSRISEIFAGVHAAGLTHNDIRPENLLSDPLKRVMAIDFGAATLPGEKPTIMAPKPYRAPDRQQASPTSDVYSLGVLFVKTFYPTLDDEIFDDLLATQDPGRRQQILQPYFEFDRGGNDSTAESLAKLAEAMLRRRPEERAAAGVATASDVFRKISEISSAARLSAQAYSPQRFEAAVASARLLEKTVKEAAAAASYKLGVKIEPVIFGDIRYLRLFDTYFQHDVDLALVYDDTQEDFQGFEQALKIAVWQGFMEELQKSAASLAGWTISYNPERPLELPMLEIVKNGHTHSVVLEVNPMTLSQKKVFFENDRLLFYFTKEGRERQRVTGLLQAVYYLSEDPVLQREFVRDFMEAWATKRADWGEFLNRYDALNAEMRRIFNRTPRDEINQKILSRLDSPIDDYKTTLSLNATGARLASTPVSKLMMRVSEAPAPLEMPVTPLEERLRTVPLGPADVSVPRYAAQMGVRLVEASVTDRAALDRAMADSDTMRLVVDAVATRRISNQSYNLLFPAAGLNATFAVAAGPGGPTLLNFALPGGLIVPQDITSAVETARANGVERYLKSETATAAVPAEDRAAAEFVREFSRMQRKPAQVEAILAAQGERVADTKARLVFLHSTRVLDGQGADTALSQFALSQLQAIRSAGSPLGPENHFVIGRGSAGYGDFALSAGVFPRGENIQYVYVTDGKEIDASFREELSASGLSAAEIDKLVSSTGIVVARSPLDAKGETNAISNLAATVSVGRVQRRIYPENLNAVDDRVIAFVTDMIPAIRSGDVTLPEALKRLRTFDPSYPDYLKLAVRITTIQISARLAAFAKALQAIGSSA